MSDRLAKLIAAAAEVRREVALADEAEWRTVRVVTVALELTTAGEVTDARGWLEERRDPRAIGLAREGAGASRARRSRAMLTQAAPRRALL